MGPALAAICDRFYILHLNVTICFEQDTQLPPFKGAMLHGWFGHALKASDEKAYHLCYGDHHGQQPKPYILCPNGDHKTQWQKGELYCFDLVLFGSSIELTDSVLVGLKIGEKLGFGRERTPFTITSISTYSALGKVSGVHPMRLIERLSHQDMMGDELALQFVTPTRIKHHGRILRQNLPGLDFWCNQILRRLTQLCRFWVDDNPQLLDDLYQERPLLARHQVTSHCYYEDWQRYSHRQKEQLPFGGLKGQISFHGDINAAKPLLEIGQILHLGGKTTFGLGRYQLIG